MCYARDHGRKPGLLITETCPLLDAFIAEHRDFTPDFVVIDTLSGALAGEDENSTNVATIALRSLCGQYDAAAGACRCSHG